mmetsp:Transcript_42139/g.164782  ORF Transcript_42139/g.164782 Transcript_42139/m.164782 type:complete len:610 (-) Transcript_42139:104-1933(-)|eukprot:CAMPEP_0113960176 /NCGR_PEP_ID=MMETSP0011_2-20120614/4562_1 /TAXON_ID=101924 /ORGANISM="Rhodosorus marinus" /LENGTH=609 /DNA_ID=CAMNT_0000971585 /DNA_START=494 /DNA_END=2323 /DNA_ORIENTATION=+ /assembly_acc=CAM_ASM_000156
MTGAVLNSADVVIVVGYFVLLALLLGLLSWRKKVRASHASEDGEGMRVKDSEDFFLAGRNATWVGVGCSLFMSNIGSEHFVALAGSGANSGLAVASFEWLASVFITLVLGYLFVPFYLSTRITTVPEFLSVRFSTAARVYIAVVTVFTGVVVKICVTLYSGSLVLQSLLGWSPWASLLSLVIGTCIYTVIGGLEAVIMTEIVQAFVLLLGGLPLAILSVQAAGGWSDMSQAIISESPDRKWMLHLFQPANGPDWVEFPWPGIVLGLPAMEVFYWCTDQVITQRVLAAKSIAHAKGGCVLTAYAKLLIPPIMVLPGLCARVLYPEVRKNSNLAFPMIVSNILPHGLLGLMVAAMLAALMSSLASTYNSTSAIISYEFYKRLRPRSTDRSLVIVGRVSIVLLTIIGILWIPVISKTGDGLYLYIQSIISYVAPPIAVVYLAGILWKGATPRAATVTLFSGGLIGFIRFVLESVFKIMENPPKNAFLSVCVYSNFLYFAFFSTCFSVFLLTICSLFTEAPQAKIDAVFAHAAKAADLASYVVVPKLVEESSDADSLDDTMSMSSAERVHHLKLVDRDNARTKCFGNDAQKTVINTFASLQMGLSFSAFWHFR